MSRLTNLVRNLWHTDAPLTGTGLLMLVLLVGSLIGLIVDPRTITGVPAWLKPAKFAVSIAIYTLTLAWVFTFLAEWTRTRRFISLTTAITMVVEMVIIVAQAWRGTTSHFNVGTPLDMALWTTMGLAIVVQTVTSIAVAVALWRQPFTDRALGWALRLGLSITIVGASTGGLMTQPTAGQLADARATHQLNVAGAHTVGAVDGGPGLPGTGWSVEHGDLRVPHFIGLHALQALPIITILLRRPGVRESTRTRMTITAAASYFLLFAILLWQALRGQPLVRPDGTTIAVLAAWTVFTVVLAWVVTRGGHATRAHAQ